ncbi:hypothetical protein [Streptomyces sp. NBC_00344]|uniref:hypothetical protein n=1 Tax=Streptomyces sp. NBC_00344 TaxID=2975720 RepID=UPI002E1D8484
MSERKRYVRDLTDERWALIAPVITACVHDEHRHGDDAGCPDRPGTARSGGPESRQKEHGEERDERGLPARLIGRLLRRRDAVTASAMAVPTMTVA